MRVYSCEDNGNRIFERKIAFENHGQVVWLGCQQNRYLSQRVDTKSSAGKRWGGWETSADLHVDGKSIRLEDQWPPHHNIHYSRRRINNGQTFCRDELVCLIRMRLSTDSRPARYSSLFSNTVGKSHTDFAIKCAGNDWRKKKNVLYDVCSPMVYGNIKPFPRMFITVCSKN